MPKDVSFESVYSQLIKDRIIFLNNELDRKLATGIVASLLLFEHENNQATISLYINSPGGDVSSLFAVYDIMQIISAPIRTICVGEACSSAAILLAAGTKGMRSATSNSRVMIHQIQIEGVAGRGTDIEVEAKEIKIIKRSMTGILARHTGQTYRKVYRDCETDTYLSAAEAKDYGIIDEILQPSKTIEILKK